MNRLLLITERFAPDLGGLARSATRLAATLSQLGIEVDVVTWSRYLQPGEVLPPEGRGGVGEMGRWGDGGIAQEKSRVYRIGLYRHWDMTMPHTLNVLDWLHQTRGYDAVWGHYLFPSGFLATWFAGLKGLPSTVSARGNDIDREMFPPGDFARLQWTLQHAKVITAVSADMSGKIRLLSGRDDVLVLKNAVDTEIFCPQHPTPSPSPRARRGEIDGEHPTTNPSELARRGEIREHPTPSPSPQARRGEIDGEHPTTNPSELARRKEALGIAADEVVLGFCGELREKKGQQFLLSALTRVKTQRPACLLIIGEVRASVDSVLQLYKTQQPEDAGRIIITGHLPNSRDVAEYLRLCDVYLQPSLWEGMPNALLEAMACGCCCIASDAGGIPEVILHGESGFVLPRSQLHRLGEAVLECLAMTPEEKNLISQAARDRILSEFSLNQEKLLLQTLIERLIPNSL